MEFARITEKDNMDIIVTKLKNMSKNILKNSKIDMRDEDDEGWFEYDVHH